MATDQQKFFMRQAIKLALDNVQNGKGGPFGAVIVKDDQIIASGANSVTRTNDPTAHAEVMAIRAACEQLQSFQLSDCELYTSCEPCPMCLGAIYWARPKKVYFAATKVDAANINFDDQFIYDEIALPHADRQIPFEPLLQDEAIAVFEAWTDSTQKVPY
ncbi:MAG: nucleoside deaminase [Chitinophagales bacterium]|jgi:tRNA(Arg) A34 adenosine deaminase TadA|nr:nucleoside deaminase [Chitinophagales bacterium]HNI43960.1 nucleoside deaminase [Chitinophagales bacterium]HNL08535.1 nucleoside deaminase [Chitinophagales bacterium]